MLSVLFFSLVHHAMSQGMAGTFCEVIDDLERGSVVCGARETELFIRNQKKIVGLKLILEDKKSGRSREVQINGVHLKLSQVRAKEFLVSPRVKKILQSVQKEWGVAVNVVVQSLEFEKNTHFYTTQDFKKEIKVNALSKEKRSLASANPSTQLGAAVMRAQNKK